MKSKKQVRRHRNKSKKFRGKLMKGGKSLNRQLLDACDNGNMDVAMALVDRGADVNARDVDESTPLHTACDKGHMEVAMALVDRGADVDARDVNQSTPLHYASIKGDSEIVINLLGAPELGGNSKKKKKLAVFDIDMQQYYDYLISQETFQDSIDCYSFKVRMKENLEKKKEEQILITELVSFFDKKTFNVMYRKYVMSYRNWLIDLDVSVDLYMGYAETELVPSYIHYNGFWDIPFAKPEHADFKLWNYNFKTLKSSN